MKTYIFYFEGISMIPFYNEVKQGEKIMTFVPASVHVPVPKTIVKGNSVLGGGFSTEELSMDTKLINSYVKTNGLPPAKIGELKVEHRRYLNRRYSKNSRLKKKQIKNLLKNKSEIILTDATITKKGIENIFTGLEDLPELYDLPPLIHYENI